MNDEKKTIGDGRKMAIGGCVGLLFGLSLGTTVAWLTHGFSNGLGWILIPHITFAMTLTGIWTVPCFLPASDDPVVQKVQTSVRDGVFRDNSDARDLVALRYRVKVEKGNINTGAGEVSHL